MKKKLGIIGGCLVLSQASLLAAATFTANNGGALGTSSVIDAGGGGDYLTLAAAAADFNTGPAVAANYTFFIASNLTEAANVGFFKNTGGFTVTLKPAASTAPVVTFTATADNVGPTGHLVIGGDPAVFDQGVKTDGFVVDGSNAVSGTTRDLTLQNATGDILGTSRVIQVWGDSDNVVVKNCKLTNLDTTLGAAAISVSTAVVTSINYVPNNTTIQNNELRSETAVNGAGASTGRTIVVSGTGQTGNANTQSGTLITGNTIYSSGQGIAMDAVQGFTISNNVIEVDQSAQTGFWTAGIGLGTSIGQVGGVGDTGSTGYTNTISGNEIRKLRTGATTANIGVSGIRFDAASSNATNVWNVYNNIITGFDAISASAVSMRYSGISCTAAAGVLNFIHNSVNLGDAPNYTALATTRGMAVGVSAGAATANVRNNIIRVGHPQCVGIYHTLPASLTSEGNTVFHAGPSTGGYGRDGSNVRATFAAWQGAGFDNAVGGGSNDADPLATTNFTWTSATNLRFSPAALPAINFPQLISTPVVIASDIDGNSRPGPTTTWPGAFEPTIPSAVADWMMLGQ